jgi:repressor of nif and glnA expression
MIDKPKENRLLILEVLSSNERPINSAQISDELISLGHQINDRTVRIYLKQLDDDGLIKTHGRRGREITGKGLQELESSRTHERVGLLSAKIDNMTYRMMFDLSTRSGTVVINITLVKPSELMKCIDLICDVFDNGYALGHLVTLLNPGERLGRVYIPEGMVGIGTVCSITLNSVLIKHGITTFSRFGGLLELRDKKPIRFVEIIMYDGTTIDPIFIFIRSGMTDYMGAVKTGNGLIGASFREIPAESRSLVESITRALDNAGLGGFMKMGRNGQSLLDVPVSMGRVGAIVIEGLNPVSILEENGIRAHSVAMAGLIDYNRLFHYRELENHLRKQIR